MPDDLQSDPLPLLPTPTPAVISAATTTSAKATGTRPAARRKRTHPTQQEDSEAGSAPKRRREVNGECTGLLACGWPYLTHRAAHALPHSGLPPTTQPMPHTRPPDGPTAATPATMPSSLLEGAPYTIKEQSVPPVMVPLPAGQASDCDGAGSLAYIEAASHEARIRRAAAERDDKGTGIAYARHVQNYSEWWDGYQSSRLLEDPSWSQIPAFPITAAKAALFLDHEVSRMKVRNRARPSPRPSAD